MDFIGKNKERATKDYQSGTQFGQLHVMLIVTLSLAVPANLKLFDSVFWEQLLNTLVFEKMFLRFLDGQPHEPDPDYVLCTCTHVYMCMCTAAFHALLRLPRLEYGMS